VILVGPALEPQRPFSRSHLYSPDRERSAST
jgi:hypothetical protein